MDVARRQSKARQGESASGHKGGAQPLSTPLRFWFMLVRWLAEPHGFNPSLDELHPSLDENAPNSARGVSMQKRGRQQRQRA